MQKRPRVRKGKGEPVDGQQRPGTASFSIPSSVKHLDGEQLATLTESFRAWYQASPRPRDRRARGRVWLTFLIIRYAGAKLGEVSAIDDRTDLDLERGTLTFGARRDGQAEREVRLPPDVIQELLSYLEDPAIEASRGEVFGLDQGFVRRKFYERAEACSIPRELASPQVLRASRALELLRGGMPLPVVQRVLGQGSANLTASYVDYEPDEVRSIFEAHLLAELRTRVSARNLFAGSVTRVVHGDILSEVRLETSEGHRLVSVITNASLENLGIREGSPVTALIKAPSVTIVTGDEPPRTSTRNVLRGAVKVVRDDGVVAEVVAELSGSAEVCALTTAESVERLGLTEGEALWVVFDTSAVILTVADQGRLQGRSVS